MTNSMNLESAISLCEEGNFSEAIPILLKLANEGDVEAQHKLAVAYEDGTGVEKDLDAARHWYHLAAKRNYINSIFNLGQIYLHSQESKYRSIFKALYFCKKGTALGDAESQEVYDEIRANFAEEGENASYVIDGFEFDCDDIHGAMYQIIDDLAEEDRWSLLDFLQRKFFPETRVNRNRTASEQISELTDGITWEQGLDYLIDIQSFVCDLDS